MATENQNDIDFLMSIDPLDADKKDIDKIIAYFRNQRAAKESGSRTRAKKDTGPQQKIDLKALGLVAAPPKINRRV